MTELDLAPPASIPDKNRYVARNASRAACSVSARSCSLWAADMKPASNAEGTRCDVAAFNRFFQFRYDTALVFVRVTPAIAARAVSVAVPLGILASLSASWGLLRGGALSLARR